MSDLEHPEDMVAAGVRQWKLANAAHAAIWPAEQAGDAAEAMMELAYARGTGRLEVPSASALRAAATARDAAQRLHNQAQILSSRRDIAEQVGYAPPPQRPLLAQLRSAAQELQMAGEAAAAAVPGDLSTDPPDVLWRYLGLIEAAARALIEAAERAELDQPAADA